MTNTDAKYLMEEIINLNFKGNDWEDTFLMSMRNRIDEGKDLTCGQGNELEELYKKAAERTLK